MRLLLETVIETIRVAEKIILVAIIQSAGSSPRSSGARMLVKKNGSFTGTVGGGFLEGRCLDEAVQMFGGSLSHRKLDFKLDSETLAGEGMICGGSVTVLLQMVTSNELELFENLLEMYRGGKRPTLLTVMDKSGNNAPQFHIADPDIIAGFGIDFHQCFSRKKARIPVLLDAGGDEVFVEPLVSPGVIHIVGAGHVAQATAQLAVFVDFEVVVIDDREEFANTNRYPMAKEVRVLASFDECFSELSPDDYVVIITRGHLHDKEVLAQALQTNAGYIGMIGSTRKRSMIYDNLLREGFSDADLARVYSPIGLSIGADTPNEIALSVVGELVQVRSGIEVVPFF